MNRSGKTSRRDFIKLTTATTLAAATSTTILAAEESSIPTRISPADKIRLGLIGAGGQGMGDTREALKIPGVELVAAADLYDGRLARAKEIWGNQLFTTRDYREVLARSDVDAVIIATPDHWHMRISNDAMNAGKDVYCEKPMVQQLEQGKHVIETAHKTGRIFQVGSQRVSSVVYKKAKDLLASGAIGELNMIEAWWDRSSAIGAWQYSIPPDASPETVDWDRYLGDAPKRPFDPKRFFRWRNYRDYGTGVAGDLFVHLFSGLHFVVGTIGPTRVMATGGLRYWNDGRDVPDVMLALCDYPKTAGHPAFNLALRVNFAAGANESSGFRFIGSEGVMTISGVVTVARKQRAKEPGYTIDTFTKATQEAFLKDYREKYPENKDVAESSQDTYAPPSGYSDSVDHFRAFFEGMRSRKPVVEDAVFGFRAAGAALLTNRSLFENQAYAWNPETMSVSKERPA
ncbi:MAG TPA: Gfo/Idh/MocA family oxidoreductase [Blastocatellia bacterium]|nr:Gfo/Idh/MocA family oxidoreductase [Blastocatellia bacterium]